MRLLVLIALAALLLGCRTNESPEGQVNDLEITTQLKSKLAADVGVSTVANISVNSTNGVVTLSGMVDSEAARAKAAAVASAVPKVVRVVNNLQVVSKAGKVQMPGPRLSSRRVVPYVKCSTRSELSC